MKKFFTAITAAAILLLGGCKNGTEVQSETVTETTAGTAVPTETSAEKATTSLTAVATTDTTTVPTETTAEETTAAKFEYPEPILPPEAVKIDVDSGFNGEKYNFDYRVLDGDNVLVLYTSENDGKVSARAKIFGISDGEEKVDINIPVTEADTFFVRDRAYPYLDDESILCQIYGCYWDEDMYIERTCTAVKNDLSYSTDYTRSGFWDNAYCRLPDGRSITRTDYGNIYEITEDGSREILLNAVYDGPDSKSNVYYRYKFAIDGNCFVYDMLGWEWIWGIGVYDFTTGEARDIPDTYEYTPLGYHDGKIYSYYDPYGGGSDNIIYVTDINTLETKPLFELDGQNMVYDYEMTSDGRFFVNTEYSPKEHTFKVILRSTDTFEIAKEYVYENIFEEPCCTSVTDIGAVIISGDEKDLYILDLDG